MRGTDIENIDYSRLKDIAEINIDCRQPVTQRIIEYLQAANNPYAFRVGKTRVKFVFDEASVGIEKKLEKLAREKIK